MTGLLVPMALQQNRSMRQTARGASLPPPVGGLNYIDELANMDPRDALILKNMFPQASYVELRRGYSSHATGMGAFPIKTLMEWSGQASRKLKAAVNGNIYDVTSAGAVGAAEVTGLSENQWQWINFRTAGGSFLVACNGTDAVRNYDGTTWTTPTITGSGLSSSNAFVNVMVHKSRLWFVEKDTTNAWYLPTSSIAGTANKQDLGVNFKLGGSLIAIGTISQDAGDGVDDYLVFISSRGEFSVYQGTDPSSANTWALVGNYRVGYPIGYRCTIDVGGDLGILCSDGVLSTFQAMKNDRSVAQRMAITNKIQRLFTDYVTTYGSNFGWATLVYPKGNWAMFNVPLSSTQFVQLVMNIDTGAWCQFENMNAASWGLLGEALYFGDTNGTVWLADTGYFDNAGPISAEIKTAWNYVGSRGENKFFVMARPNIQVTGSPTVFFGYDVDFNNVSPTGAISSSAPESTLWGTATWGTGVWGGQLTLNTEWQTPGTIGYCGSAHIVVSSSGSQFILNSIDLQVQPGGPI